MLSSYHTKDAGKLKMYLLYATSIVLMFVCPFSSGAVQFTKFPENKLYVVQGETAKIVWDYHADNIYAELDSQSPRWYFQNDSFFIGYGDVLDGHKFKIKTDTCPRRLWTPSIRVSVEGKATLVITNVTLKDSGIYGCILVLLSGSASSMPTSISHLIVTESPTFTKKPSGSTNITEYTHLSILCTAVGTPLPNVTWKNVSNSMEPAITKGQGSAELKIENITRNYNGQKYRCEAVNNPIEGAIMQETELIVNYKPTIDKDLSNSSVESWNGHTIKLICGWSSSNPPPTWLWNKPSGDGIFASSSIPHSSEVTVITTDKGDYGSYKCTASNLAGIGVHIINVTQLFRPGPPSMNVTDIEASSAVVRWTEPVDNGGSEVIGYKVEIDSNIIAVLEGNYFILPGLKKDKVYTVKLYARNVVGYGNASSRTFTTKKKGPPDSPILKIVKSSPTTVILSWSKPEENGGEIRHYTIYKKRAGGNKWSQVGTLAGETLTYTVKGLLPGKTYSFLITAKNKDGESIKDFNKVQTLRLPIETTTLPTTSATVPSKDKSSGDESDPNQPIIIAGAVVAVVLIAVTAVISIVILRKKNAFGKSGKKRNSNQQSAAYHNDVDSSDSVGRGAAVVTLNDDSAPTYAAVDMTKKTKKKDEIPNYAAVDKSKKKKKPGEIIYAELADFNTNNVPAASRPAQYTETDYADISQFQNQIEPEPTYANFPGRSKDYNI